MMEQLPKGVERFDPVGASETARHNIILSLYGDSKTGKTHFAVRSDGPRYIAYLDPNAALEFHLAKAYADGFTSDVYKCIIPPVPYDDLSGPMAHNYVAQVEDFAKWARAQASADVKAGKPGGTFIVDGMTMLKGYYEKDLLGESATLGWRAAKGERGGPSTFDYAKSNGALRDFVSSFMAADLDVILIWEGRQDYAGGEPLPGKFHSTMPVGVPFAITCEAQVFVELTPVVVNQVQTGTKPEPRVRITRNTYGLEFFNRDFAANGFVGLKRLLLAGLED